MNNPEIIIPVLGIMCGIIVPLAVFVWLYNESKDKNKTILEISKNIDDPSKLEDLIGLLDERKKEPIDYRRSAAKMDLKTRSLSSCHPRSNYVNPKGANRILC